MCLFPSVRHRRPHASVLRSRLGGDDTTTTTAAIDDARESERTRGRAEDERERERERERETRYDGVRARRRGGGERGGDDDDEWVERGTMARERRFDASRRAREGERDGDERGARREICVERRRRAARGDGARGGDGGFRGDGEHLIASAPSAWRFSGSR